MREQKGGGGVNNSDLAQNALFASESANRPVQSKRYRLPHCETLHAPLLRSFASS